MTDRLPPLAIILDAAPMPHLPFWAPRRGNPLYYAREIQFFRYFGEEQTVRRVVKALCRAGMIRRAAKRKAVAALLIGAAAWDGHLVLGRAEWTDRASGIETPVTLGTAMLWILARNDLLTRDAMVAATMDLLAQDAA